MNLILLGAPGAGKGTQAVKIASKYGIPHISTGDIFRKNIKEQTPIGVVAKSYIDKGQLVPDEVTVEIVRLRLAESDAQNGFLLDGFPRTIAQANALKQMLAERGHEMGVMIELVVEEDILMARLLNRAIEQGRADDNEETIKKRFDVYKNQTAPLIDWFENEGIRKTFCWANTPTKEGMLSSIFEYLDTLA